MSETRVPGPARWRCSGRGPGLRRLTGWGPGAAPGPEDGPDRGGRTRLTWPLPLVVAVVQVAGSTITSHHQDTLALNAPGYLLLLLGPAMLVLRHRRPVAVAAGTAAVALVYLLGGYAYGPVLLSPVVGFISAVAAGHRRPAWTAIGLLYATHVLVGGWLYHWLPGGRAGPSWAQEAGGAAWLFMVVAVAELARVRREQYAQARLAHRQAERRRADEERMRIARELHDVLAHSISVVNVQAGVALALMDEHPEQARTALTAIKSASKDALDEVRQVLDALRTPGGAAPRSPAPGLGRLPELAEQAAGAGLRVTVETRGDRVPLPSGTDLAAFRIVQEALTNVVRHSGSRTAHVVVEYGADRLGLLVDDEGPPTAAGETGGGNGLVGMRERAAALGGTVEAGPRGDGGFRVSSGLPLAGGAAGQDRGRRPEPAAPAGEVR